MFRTLLVLAVLMFSSSARADFVCPNLQGRVNDYLGVLTADQRLELDRKLHDLENKTSSQVVILTVPDSQGMELEDFSLKVAETWQLGQKGVDNGILITYSADGDHFRIEVGYGLEGAIPDGKAGEIRDDGFRKYAPKDGTKDFNLAFTATVDQISKIITEEYAKDPSGKSLRRQDPNLLGIALAVVCLIVVLIVEVWSHRRFPMSKEMSMKEFQESGLLQEMNRRFLHPMGLAIYVRVDKEKGTIEFGGIIDNREDPTGIHFADNCVDFTKAKEERVDNMLNAKRVTRWDALGFFVQPTPDPKTENEAEEVPSFGARLPFSKE